MFKNSKLEARPLLTGFSISIALLWCASCLLLLLIAPPMISLDNGYSFVLDRLALVEATTIMVGFAVLSWLPILLLAPRRPSFTLFVLTSACVWIPLGVCFYLLDASGPESFGAVLIGRAANALANGSDMIFEPIVIPSVSLVSGGAYCLFLGLLQHFSPIIEVGRQELEGASL